MKLTYRPPQDFEIRKNPRNKSNQLKQNNEVQKSGLFLGIYYFKSKSNDQKSMTNSQI